MWIYCKTVDDPKKVGELICKFYFVQGIDKKKPRIWNDKTEDGCWVIKTDCVNEIAAMIYRAGNEVVVIEIDDRCAADVIESLIIKYGFDNVKWLLAK